MPVLGNTFNATAPNVAAPGATGTGLSLGPQFGELPTGVQSIQQAAEYYSRMAHEQSYQLYGHRPGPGNPAGLAESERSHMAAVNQQNRDHQSEVFSIQRDHEAKRLAQLFPGVTPWELLGNASPSGAGASAPAQGGSRHAGSGAEGQFAAAIAQQQSAQDLQREELKTRLEVAQTNANAQIKSAEISSGAHHRLAGVSEARAPFEMALAEARAGSERVMGEQVHPADAFQKHAQGAYYDRQQGLTAAQTKQYLAQARNLNAAATHEQVKMGLTHATVDKTQAEAILAKLGIPEASLRAELADRFVSADIKLKEMLDLESGSNVFRNAGSGVGAFVGSGVAATLYYVLSSLPYSRGLKFAKRLGGLAKRIPGVGKAIERWMNRSATSGKSSK